MLARLGPSTVEMAKRLKDLFPHEMPQKSAPHQMARQSVPDTEVLQHAEVKSIHAIPLRSQLRWAGHVQ